jgi:DNA polymerase-3 subunit delta
MSPVVYLFHGEDEFSMFKEIQKLEKRLGDETRMTLNTTRLDGRTLSFEELESAARALPFLASRRLVEVHSLLAKVDSNPALQERLRSLLGNLPESTALVLVEYRSLPVEQKKSSGKKKHWLQEWVEQAGEKAYVRSFPAPDAKKMPGWILDHARQAGGRFTPQAATTLAPLVGDDTRLAHQEIVKLLTYVNYQRPVEVEDVQAVTALSSEADIFKMVDALGMQNGQQASSMLHRLLEVQDAQYIFIMIVRQFRLLLLAAETLESGGSEQEVIRELHLHPFVAQKVSAQARRFSLDTLEAVYRRLLEIDEAIKTGQMEMDVALDTFVAGFTMRQ